MVFPDEELTQYNKRQMIQESVELLLSLINLFCFKIFFSFRNRFLFFSEYFGNPLLQNKKLLSLTQPTIYLLPEHGLKQGVVMEMFVYIEFATDLYLQVWRPRSLEGITGEFNFTLIGQKLLPGTHYGNYSVRHVNVC